MDGERLIEVDKTNIEYIVKRDPKKYKGNGKEIKIWPKKGIEPSKPKSHAKNINKIIIKKITIGGKIIDFQLFLIKFHESDAE
jgi:hypothetical protein